MIDFGHLITAMVTPMNEDLQVDYDKTSALIDHLINTGTESLVVAGTTGESPTLSKEEKVSLIEYAVAEADGKAKIIAGTGSNNTLESVALTKKAEATGADAVMLVAPYYNKPSQEGLYLHFKTIAESTSLPVMLYNVPGRTSANMSVDTVIRLSEVDNIICIKEASGNLSQMSYIIENTPDDFVLYSGDDGMTLPVLSIGGKGVVSVASHVIGSEMKEMMDAFLSGAVGKAATIHRSLLPIYEGMFVAPSPAPIKKALNLRGVAVGDVRLPLVALTEQEEKFLASLFS